MVNPSYISFTVAISAQANKIILSIGYHAEAIPKSTGESERERVTHKNYHLCVSYR
jgi:hypothetical protein